MDAVFAPWTPWLKTWFTLRVKIPPGHGPQVKSSMFPFTEWVCRVYPLIDSQPRNVAVVGRLALVASKAEMYGTWVLRKKKGGTRTCFHVGSP